MPRTATSVRSPWLVVATVLYGLFSVDVTITILAVSIHRIAGEFDTADATMTWVVIGPMLAFGVIGPSSASSATASASDGSTCGACSARPAWPG